MATIAELYQAVFIQPHPRDAALFGGIDNSLGAWPELVALDDADYLLNALIERKRTVIDQRLDVLYGDLQQAAHATLGLVLDGDLVDVFSARANRLSAIYRNAYAVGEF